MGFELPLVQFISSRNRPTGFYDVNVRHNWQNKENQINHMTEGECSILNDWSFIMEALFHLGRIVALIGCSTWGENYSSQAHYDKAFWNSLIGIQHHNIYVNSWRAELVHGLKLIYKLKLGWEDARMTASKTCCYFRNILSRTRFFFITKFI